MNINNYDFKNNRQSCEEYVQKKTVLYISIILVISSAALGVCGGILGANYVYNSKSGNNKVASSSTSSNIGSANGISVTEVARIATDSVVEISTETVKTNELMKQYISSGAGSGVILSSDGYILTNNHVISGASKVTVTLNNKNTYEAKVIGKDSAFDIAVIKIEVSNLKATSLGNSSSLQLGEQIVAIGNPLGQLGGTITNGIISALNRDITINGETMNLLQTNALINPGNSGGGLFNHKGELIGLVVAKSSGSGIEGIGFAIPIDNIKTIINEIKQDGHINETVQTELSLIDVASQQVANMYGVNGTGVLVTKVPENTNVSRAGFKVNDFILSIGSEGISTVSDFERIIKNHNPNDTVSIAVKRGNKNITLRLSLAEKSHK